MGLEILDEYRALMPLRSVRTLNQLAEVETASKEEQECHTPTSSPPPTLLCPPPPKKPRPCTNKTTLPSQPFFQVPHDLASVFLLRAKPDEPIC
uniref:Uncharacterized protein n=1 Tax=Cajanus cajan TaxID=3821 RepID=A0A151SCM0_CAJCA|nr:hypothetical protein KK1_025514 [Cajanus cajan]